MKPLKKWSFGSFLLLYLFATLSGSALSEQVTPKQGSKKLPRAYKGAPPLIPHDVERRKGACLGCHGKGFVGAPIVPHPTRNYVCLQCHIGQDLSVKAFSAASSQEKKRPE
ncbi:MAG: nitrate reductase cytochrome c-type subunit [candidate division NC10 bacterium]|nr:nitrate reductase cytochrome c-type subunit [candidate division NC10 bacterium]